MCINYVSCELTKLLMSSSSFLVVSLGFFMFVIASSANDDNFSSSFPIWIPFIYFFSLSGMGGTSKTMSNKKVESGYSSLVSDLRGILSAFHH